MIKLTFLRFSKGLNFNDWSLLFILITSLISLKLVPLGFILWVLTIGFNKESFTLKKLFSDVKKWFIFYYILLLLGMLWTDNTAFGFSKLENKLSFLLLPLLFSLSNFSITRNKLIQVFIFSLSFSLIINYGIVLYETVFLNQRTLYEGLINANFSHLMHRSYYCYYLVVGCIILLNRFLKEDKSWIDIVLFVFFSAAIFQTLAKSGILIYLILIPLFVIWKLIKRKQYAMIGICLLVLVSTITLLIQVENPVKTRFKMIPDAIEHFKSKNTPSAESNTSRLLMWSTSIDVFKEAPFNGVGTGDYDDELTEKNRRYGNTGVVKHRYNSHNQYLNTMVQLGLLGLIVLMMIFLIGFKKALQEKDLVLLFTLMAFLLNFLFESFIESQAGIILFCLLPISLISLKIKANA